MQHCGCGSGGTAVAHLGCWKAGLVSVPTSVLFGTDALDDLGPVVAGRLREDPGAVRDAAALASVYPRRAEKFANTCKDPSLISKSAACSAASRCPSCF